MRRNERAWNGTATEGDGFEETDSTDAATTDANRLAGSTMISLGYHRGDDRVGVECKKDKKTDPEGFSDVGVKVASAAFVLAGVALSTIPAVMV